MYAIILFIYFIFPQYLHLLKRNACKSTRQCARKKTFQRGCIFSSCDTVWLRRVNWKRSLTRSSVSNVCSILFDGCNSWNSPAHEQNWVKFSRLIYTKDKAAIKGKLTRLLSVIAHLLAFPALQVLQNVTHRFAVDNIYKHRFDFLTVIVGLAEWALPRRSV